MSQWLTEAEDAYRRPLSLYNLEEENYMPEEKLIDEKNWEEHYVRKGDPKKPTYYIIRRGSVTGLFARYKIIAGHIRYALSKGWIPVVDMQNYSNEYLPPEKLGKENSWEYFFEQPLRIGLEQAYNGENIILSRSILLNCCPFESTQFFENQNGILTEWRMLIELGFLKLKDELMEEIIRIREKLFAPTDRVLGLHLRGTDYFAKRPKWHPIQPPPEYAKDVLIEKIRPWKCNKIFLATEDESILQFFKDTFHTCFNDFFITFDKDYIKYDATRGSVTNQHSNRENDCFLRAKEYIIEMVLLSMCTSFITPRCSGSVAVMLMAKKFENVHVFDFGQYGVYPVDLRKIIGK